MEAAPYCIEGDISIFPTHCNCVMGNGCFAVMDWSSARAAQEIWLSVRPASYWLDDTWLGNRAVNKPSQSFMFHSAGRRPSSRAFYFLVESAYNLFHI